MNKNIFTSILSEEVLDRIERERTQTMSTEAFNQWCKDLRVSASYVDKNIHNDKASSMMNMIDREEWIATFKRHNKLTNW